MTTSAVDLPEDRIRELIEILDIQPLLPGHLIRLADFIAGYYRSPLGEVLATMLPASLLRADAETLALTREGVAVDPDALPGQQGAVLAALQSAERLTTAAVLARAGAASRTPVDALAERGLIRIKHRRRDRAPRVDVTGVRLVDGDVEAMLADVRRAPQQLRVVRWLAEQGRPVLQTELQEAVGCSASVVSALEKKGLVERFKQAPQTRPRWTLPPNTTRPHLTAEQDDAVRQLSRAVEAGDYAPFVLQGVTGSGKTEVYLRALERAIAGGRRGLVLVPEIGLTPAAVGAVERRFGDRVAVLHSGQSEGERWLEWRRVHHGEVDVVIGPRSALFAPVDDLGFIVVDEEQDAAYKQQEAPRYSARDLALVLGKQVGAPVLLCSATPSLEAIGLVERGLASQLSLTRRVAGGTLPTVEIVDLRNEPPHPGEHGKRLFSSRLLELISEVHRRGEQSILLMQRRGWAPILMCRECGHRIECEQCSVAMVVHRRSRDLRCHYCAAHRPIPRHCPGCGGELLESVGAGTEKVAHLLHEEIPGLRIGVLDRDTVRRRGGLQEVLGAFSAGTLDTLVGTQMVAKGHHFPNVTLTGVISADALLGLPDFRAAERTFQLLTQVAGRAGRGERPGHVLIQTYYPESHAVRHALTHDVAAYAQEELTFRRTFGYPPFTRMAVVRFESNASQKARDAAHAAAEACRPLPRGATMRGPAPAPLERLRGQWRWQILLTAPNRAALREVLQRIEAASTSSSVHRVIDVDPLSTL